LVISIFGISDSLLSPNLEIGGFVGDDVLDILGEFSADICGVVLTEVCIKKGKK